MCACVCVLCVAHVVGRLTLWQLLARYVLFHQLYLNRLADPTEAIPAELDVMFRSAWVEYVSVSL